MTAAKGAASRAAQRLAVLNRAEALGNISQACVEARITRQTFYRWKARYKAAGLTGLEDRPRKVTQHPNSLPQKAHKALRNLALAHPGLGADRLAAKLAETTGKTVSPATIQKSLTRHGLARREDRVAKLETAFGRGQKLTSEQVSEIERVNPCFRHRDAPIHAPGRVLVQSTFRLAHLSHLGLIYLQAVVDCYSTYAFAELHQAKAPDAAVAALRDQAMPFYEGRGLTIGTVFTSNDPIYVRKRGSHPYQDYLGAVGIRHRRFKRRPWPRNGFLEHFNRAFSTGFFPKALQLGWMDSFPGLQREFAAWLKSYNEATPHRGFPNMGLTPAARIERYLSRPAA